MDKKYIPTKESDEIISPKMFLRKYRILEKGIYCVNCNFSYTEGKMGAAEKHIQNNESTKHKNGKKGCKFIEFL